MEISKAALPPRQPVILPSDRSHPLFATYMNYRSGMSAQLVEADSFKTWLLHRDRDQRDAQLTALPEYRKFKQWMWDTRGGARECPAGNWPHNFNYWIEGGRW